jgi:hypothetical protein
MNPEMILAMGAGIAGVTAILKAAFPDMPARFIPLIVVAVSSAFVVAGVQSHAIDGGALNVLLQIVQQAVAALGIREGVVAVAPQASTLPSRS